MRITFIMPTSGSSGGSRVIGVYAAGLSARGHQVLIIEVPPPRSSWRDKLRAIVSGRWSFSKNAQWSHLDSLNLSRIHLKEFRAPSDQDVPDGDVVIATFWTTAQWVQNLSPSKGAKVYFMQDYGAPGQELEHVIPTWGLPLHIITISEWLGRLIRSHFSEREITVIQNSVDLSIFNAPPRGKQPVPTVGMVYREMHSKGADVGIEAMRLAQLAMPNIKFIIFGPDTPTITLPANTNVIANANDTELAAIYASVDVWLFPSRIEGFGLPISEAMACRTPVISTKVGAAPELLITGGGTLVDSEDTAAMAGAIVNVCSLSNEDWLALSDSAYEAVQGYSWSHAVTLFEQELFKANGD